MHIGIIQVMCIIYIYIYMMHRHAAAGELRHEDRRGLRAGQLVQPLAFFVIISISLSLYIYIYMYIYICI